MKRLKGVKDLSPRFVTTKLPVPRHRDGRSAFNPFSELPLLAVLANSSTTSVTFSQTINES